MLKLIPAKLAQNYRCLPLFVKHDSGAGVLFVGMEYPSDLAAVDDLSFHAGMELQPVLVAPSELHEAIDRYYRPASRGGPFYDDADDATSEFKEPESAPEVESAAPPEDPPRVEDVVDALAELLIEKQLITREEFAAQLRSMRIGTSRSR